MQTPIQQIIEQLKQASDKWAKSETKDGQIRADSYEIATILAKRLLPAEQKLLEETFDAGYSFGIEDHNSYEGHKYKNLDKQTYLSQFNQDK